jgi:hypothetical protein
MPIYHIERTVTISETYVEVWEVQASCEDEAKDTVEALGIRLSVESDSTPEIADTWITDCYKVAE